MMRRPRIKICGIRDPETALLAAREGADSLGFVFHPESPRYVSPQTVREITRKLPPFVNRTGVFVRQNADEILRIAEFAGLDTVQLHGGENGPDEEMISRIREKIGLSILVSLRVEKLDGVLLSGLDNESVNGWLIDRFDPSAYGGTGKAVELPEYFSDEERSVLSRKVVLAGGIRAGNVQELLTRLQPWGIDVSSGLESEKGVKDPEKIRDFMRIVRGVTFED
jgi:phosphoribosylanthranilate isomerase